MQTTYDGKHGIIFCQKSVFGSEDGTFPEGCGPDNFYGGYHSWWTFGLVPASRPFVAPPPQKASTVEIPGANGIIDLSKAPLGIATFGERTGSWEFYIANDVTNEVWSKTYDYLMNRLHGRDMAVVLTDDPSYYYYGRITVNSYASDKMTSKITINYNLYPYKKMIWDTLGDWLWDPFNFNTGIVYDRAFKGIVVETEGLEDYQTFIFRSAINGNMPVVPKFYADLTTNPDPTELAMNLRVWNVYRQSAPVNVTIHTSVVSSSNDTVVRKGTLYDPSIIIMNIDEYDKVKIEFAGVGVVDIEFVPGRL